ncbi:MAG TPA: hypothetical protein PL110_10780 [Candidatus Eremiobacteraeota bacterium]|nr:MAG: hypothetical protein BWY64_01080 [bacterium ADurb.Bin363]HPZ08588.1 hypothetical protein [Candidatus Eremiobacteraeota bacterium]
MDKKEKLLELGLTSKHMDNLINAVEQIRSGKLAPEKLKDIIIQMKNKIDETAAKIPDIAIEVKNLKNKEGLEAVGILEDGINIYQKAYNILSLFLMESNKAHLEEGLKVIKEAYEKLTKGQEMLARVLKKFLM